MNIFLKYENGTESHCPIPFSIRSWKPSIYLKCRIVDADTHNSDKRPDCKWKETSKIRLQRSLLESNYTIKNVNNRFEVGREIYLPWLIHVYTTYG